MTTDPSSAASILIALAARDEALLASLALMLRSAGFEVLTYYLGTGLLADPAAMDAHWLFVDERLSDSSGKALTQALRARGWTGTAVLMVEHQDAVAQAGEILVLEKPFSAPALMALFGQAG